MSQRSVLELCTNLLDLFRIKQGECYKNKGYVMKDSVFQHFPTYLCVAAAYQDIFLC